MVRLSALTVCLVVLLVARAAPAAEPVVFDIDGGRTFAISPYVYGTNPADWKTWSRHLTLGRWGGNRITAYNWETNASNAGSDWNHQNDALLSNTDKPGEAVRTNLAAAFDAGAAYVVTVPLAGYVAADKKGDGDVKQTPDYLAKRFCVSLPAKQAPLSMTPDPADGKVYQDEFVNWLEKTFPESARRPGQTIFYALDNEPDLWAGTHARIHPQKATYEEVARLNAEYAAAIKAVAPKALVFGFVSYGWHGFRTLQDAPDGKGRDFLDFYLDAMAAAEKKAGRRLVDVLDLHWYPEARGGNVRITEDQTSAPVAAARIQAPRSLWDPTFKEESWITGNLREPIRLLPRVREQIEKHYPGTRLAMTEYTYGAGDHISGGLAQADALGIFGREGLFAAAWWKTSKGDDRFGHGGFALYRDYDGKGGAFGDTGLAATCSDAAKASVYASRDAQGRLVLVAINKTTEPLPVRLNRANCPAAKSVTTYRMDDQHPQPQAAGETPVGPGPVELTLPALSASTLVFTP